MRAAIIGYGKSGAAAEKLLKLKGINHIDIYDNNAALGFKPIEEFCDKYDLTVLSPGIDRNKYGNLPTQVTSEVELAYEFLPQGAKVIAVTGTNGKSTTTYLAAQILNKLGVNAVACGNIGLPFGEAVLKQDTQVFVAELSSFQIDLLHNFKAESACIINVTQDHLDRYGNMDNYRNSKLRLLDFVSHEGVFICGNDKEITRGIGERGFSTVIVDDSFKRYPVLKDNILDFGEFSVDLSKFPLFGGHNIVNLSFALLLSAPFAALKGDISHCVEHLNGMPHRTELVGEFNGVKWINDSKGTNVDSVMTALKSIKKPSILLLGGRDKKSDFRILKDLINNNVSTICYFGEAASVISSQLGPITEAEQKSFISLENAVEYCASNSPMGATVLLSPGCTSFDEFKSYEHRGEKFAEYVNKYARGQHD